MSWIRILGEVSEGEESGKREKSGEQVFWPFWLSRNFLIRGFFDHGRRAKAGKYTVWKGMMARQGNGTESIPVAPGVSSRHAVTSWKLKVA
jgi:hypothetical protein